MFQRQRLQADGESLNDCLPPGPDARARGQQRQQRGMPGSAAQQGSCVPGNDIIR